MSIKKLLRQALEQKQVELFEQRRPSKKNTLTKHRNDGYYTQIIEAQRALGKKKKR